MKIQKLIGQFSMDLTYDKEKEEIKILDDSITFKNIKLQTLLTKENLVEGLEKILNFSDITYGILSLGAKLVDLYPQFLENNSSIYTRDCYIKYKGEKYFCGISNKPRGRITGLTDFYRKFPNDFKENSLIKYKLYVEESIDEYTNELKKTTIIEITDVFDKK